MKHPGTSPKCFAVLLQPFLLVGVLIVAPFLAASEAGAQNAGYMEPTAPTSVTPSGPQSTVPSSRNAGELPELVWLEDRWCEEIEDYCPISGHDFGTIATGSSGPYLGLWLHNRSESTSATNLSLQLDEEFLLFPDMSDCSVFNELPPGGLCRLRIKFAPSIPGPVTSAITMTSAEVAEVSLPVLGSGGDDHLLYGQFHDWETTPGVFGLRNAIYANSPGSSSELADDFLVEDPEGWIITQVGYEVFTTAFLEPQAQVDSINVYITLNDDGIPSDVVVCSAPDSEIHFWEPPQNENRVEITLSSPCELPPGHYWLRIQLHTDHIITSRLFGWGTRYLTGDEEEPPGKPSIHLNPAAWRHNPDFFTCTTWTPIYPPACGLEDWWPLYVAYDAVFYLIGEGKAAGTGPKNDHIANAIVISPVNDSYAGTNIGATLENGEPEPSCTFEDWTTNFSVWWTFTADEEANRVTIDTFDSEFDTILSLHRADNLEEVACNDDADRVQSQTVDAPIVAGETYLIRVAGYDQSGTNQGDIQLTVEFHTVSGEPGSETFVTSLTAPSPNPVRGTAAFTLTVDREQSVVVEVFDVMGRRVQTLYSGSLIAGAEESLTLNTSSLSSGMYIIRATGEDFLLTQRVTVIR